MSGGSGRDTLVGDTGNDFLDAGDDDDSLIGGSGHDSLFGGLGADTLVGGGGNDLYQIDDVTDRLIESPRADGGKDSVKTSVSYTLGIGLENLVLSGEQNTNATGNPLSNQLIGNNGNNLLSGDAGNDALAGGLGDDTLAGGAGSDVLDGGKGSDTARYNGPKGNYDLQYDAAGNTWIIKDILSGEADQLSNIEFVQFSNKNVDVSAGPALPILTVSDAEQSEGDAATSTVQFILTLSEAAAQPVSVDYATSGVSAQPVQDYNSAGGTVTFAPGETRKTVAVTLLGDSTVEPDEALRLVLDNAVGLQLGNGYATATLINDDWPTLSISGATVDEGDSGTGTVNVTLSVSLSAAVGVPVTVNYATANGSANSAGDYSAAGGKLTFAPGETAKNLTLTVKGDTTVEGDETFRLLLSDPANAKLSAIADNATITIHNDDLPALSIAGAAIMEGNSGTRGANLTVTLSSPSTQTVTVDYASADGTATADSDYTATHGTLVFASGETSKTVTVSVSGDTEAEDNESFQVQLASPSNAELNSAAAGAQVTIIKDELPTLSIASTAVIEGNSGSKNAGLTVTLSSPFTQAVTVNYATVDGTAKAGSDYTAVGGTLTFAPGETSQTLMVPILGNTLQETDETLLVKLSSPRNATLSGTASTATLAISNDDSPASSLTISSDKTSFKAGDTATVFFTFSEIPTGFTSSGVTVTGGTLTALTPDATGKIYTATFTPTANTNSWIGAISVAAATYTDTAGNNGAAGNVLSLTGDTLAPSLTGSTPADNATAVAVGSNIVLTFSESVQAGIGGITLSNGGDNRTLNITDATQVSISGNTVTLNPATNLSGGSHYSVQMAGGVFKDLAGNPYAGLSSAGQLDFTTAATGSLVLSSDKTHLKVGETAVITFTFPDAPLGFTASDVTVSGGTLSGPTADNTGKVYTAQFTPTASIDSLTGAISLAQGSYTDPLGTPGAASSNTLSLKIDTLAPTFTSSSPADNATAVAVSSNIVLTFSEAVQAGTGNIVISNGADARTIAVTDTSQVSISGNTVTINPTADWKAGSTYNVQELLSGVFKDLAGNVYTGIGDESTFSFSTADTTAPTLTSSTPADNATSVAVSSNIVLTFNETVKAGSGNIVISNGTDTRTIAVTDASQVTVSGSTVTINPTADLIGGSAYNVQLASGVIKDTAGNAYAGISNATMLDFATVGNANVSSANLLVHYDFNGNTNDTSGNNNHGTLFGTPSFVAGESDGAVYINNPYHSATGTQYIHLPSMDLGTSSFTIAIKYKSTDTDKANGRLFGHYSGSNNDIAMNYMAGGSSPSTANPNIAGGMGSRGGVTAGQNDPNGYATDGAWHWQILVLDRDAGALRLYLDQNLLGSVAVSNVGSITLSDHSIGREEGTGTMTGYSARLTTIDDFRVYNVALSDMSALINAGDTIAPTLSSSSPLDNATAVAVSSNIVLTFSEAVQAGTGNIVISNGTDTRTISVTDAGQVGISGSSITINPTADLSGGSNYNVQFAGGVIKDLAGNAYAGISNATALNFTTVDTLAPTLSSSTPADNATTVAVSSNIVLTFSEAVQVGTGNIIISNGSDIRTIDVTDTSQVSISGSTVTINPAADLNSGGAYNVQMASGVIKDTAGNAYVGISNASVLDFTIAGSPTLSVVSTPITEGDSGNTNAIVTLTLSTALTQQAPIQYATDDASSATPNVDFVGTTGTVIFQPGEIRKTLSIPIVGDIYDEDAEYFKVYLWNGTVANIAPLVTPVLIDPSAAIVTIINDDRVVSIAGVTITEGNSGIRNATVTVTMSRAYNIPIELGYSTANGTANAGSDYTETNGSLIFNSGETSKILTIPIIGDTTIENSETFQVVLNGAMGYRAVISPTAGTATVTINDDDALSVVPLAGLNGNNGFRLDGATANQNSNWWVNPAGDVNGDGFDDVIVGDSYGTASSSYVVFGKASGFASSLALSSLDGSNGFRLDGEGDGSRRSVSDAGDVNGDGFDDVIVGAYGAKSNAGSSYVVFGKANGFTASVTPASLDGSNGFRLDGVTAGDMAGMHVNSAGDVNGDGFADLMIGAFRADPNGNDSGSSYVVFGKASGFSASVALSSLDGSNGFRLDGVAAEDWSALVLDSAGDINGDGFSDMIIGAYRADPNGSYAGSSYVVFGKASGFTSSMALSSLNGSTGFRLDGVAAGDRSGMHVGSAGDINGDSLDDLIVSAAWADPNGNSDAGSGYVVFGKTSGFAASMNLAGLDGSNGFRLDGAAANDSFSRSIGSAGDVNGDGFDDLIVGALWADPNGADSGSSYVVFGKAVGFAANMAASSLDGSNGFRLDGVAAGDWAGWSVNSAGDVNGDGFDDLIVGARNADPNGVGNAGSSYVIFGGNSTGAVTFLGGGGNDALSSGTTATERFVGGGGNDTMTGAGGADVWYGGQGNDTLIVADLAFQRADGGSGSDTLALAGTGLSLNLANLRGKIEAIETINLTGSGDNTVVMTALDVRNLSDTGNTLQVDGNAGDHYSWSDSGWTAGADVVLLGVTYHAFDNGQAHVLLNSALAAV